MKELLELRTKNKSLILRFENERYYFLYFGTALKDSRDAKRLCNLMPYSTSLHYPSQATYPTFGGDTEPEKAIRKNMDAYGALTLKHSDGTTSTILTTEKVEFSEVGGVEDLSIFMKDSAFDFRVIQHFRAYRNCDTFETYVELINEEPSALAISRMDSFSMEFNGMGEGAILHNLAGHWGAEGICSSSEIGLGQAATIGSRSGVHGAWDSNPAFMVSCGKSTETTGRVFGGALAWPGAWCATVARTHNNALTINSGVDNCSGPYILDAGKSITLPSFYFTISDCGRGEISRSLHAFARNHLMSKGKELRPILLNSWEGAYFRFSEDTLTSMMDGVREMGGEMFVIDDGWFGEGAFARNDDTKGLGDWVWNYEKLPRGPKYISEEAKCRGLRLGLWFEPEMANTVSDIYTKHPEWILREERRPLRSGRGGTQVVLDLCNAEVRDYIFGLIDKLLGEVPGITYVKWDANANFMNVGAPSLPPEKQANVWFDYAQGYLELAERLAKKHPHVLFQACSSGGGRVEFGSLKAYADECWGSDNTDAPMRVLIQWGEMQFYAPSAIACHVTASPNHQTGREVSLKYRFDVASSGRLGFELHPKNLTAAEIDFAKKAVENYKRIRPVIQQGDLYRLHSPYEGDYAASMYVSADKRRAVLFVYGLARGAYLNAIAPIRLQGLNKDFAYTLREINNDGNPPHAELPEEAVGGDALEALGITVRLKAGYDSAVFELTSL